MQVVAFLGVEISTRDKALYTGNKLTNISLCNL